MAALAFVLADRRAPALAAYLSAPAVRAYLTATAVATSLTPPVVRADAGTATLATLDRLSTVGTPGAHPPCFTGDTTLAAMAVAVDLEICFNTEALTLRADEELSTLRVVGSHTG